MKRLILVAILILLASTSFAEGECAKAQDIIDNMKIIERATTPAELVKQWQQAKKLRMVLASMFFDDCEIKKPWIMHKAIDSLGNLITYHPKNENDLNEESLHSILHAYSGAANGLLSWKEMTYSGYMHVATLVDAPGEELARAVEKRNKLKILPPIDDTPWKDD